MSYILYNEEQTYLLHEKIIPFMYYFGFRRVGDTFDYVMFLKNYKSKGTTIRKFKHNFNGRSVTIPIKIVRYFDSGSMIEMTKEIYPAVTDLYFDVKKFITFVNEQLDLNKDYAEIISLWNATNYKLTPDKFFKLLNQLFTRGF